MLHLKQIALQLKSIVRMRAGQELGMSAGIKVAVQVRMEVAAIPVCHTGTKSRDLLPLWKRAARGIGLDRSLEGPYYGFR